MVSNELVVAQSLVAVISYTVALVCYLIAFQVAPFFSKTFRQLDYESKCEWASRLVSNIHAVVACYGAYGCYMYDTGWHSDKEAALGLLPIRLFYLTITIGYLSHDFVLCLFHRKSFGNNLIIAHHVVIITAFTVGIANEAGTFYMFCFLFNEITTFFVNQHWFLIKMGLKESAWFVGNLALLCASFLTVRVLFNGFLLLHMARTWWRLTCGFQCNDDFFYTMSLTYRVTLVFLTSLSWAHCAINVVWFGMICRKLRLKLWPGERKTK